MNVQFQLFAFVEWLAHAVEQVNKPVAVRADFDLDVLIATVGEEQLDHLVIPETWTDAG